MRYQVSRKVPFPGRELDSYFFTTPALRLRLDLLQELVARHESPVMILGESGVGKSTLLNQLICRAAHKWRIVRVPAVHSFSASDVVTFLNAELRLHSRGSDDDKLAAFDAWLVGLAMEERVAVVVVDNAHNLNDESLLRLGMLRETTKSKNLCILMTGEPALGIRMHAMLGTSSSSKPVHAVNVPCLDQCEVASYIDMRFYHAGLEGRAPFNRATIKNIARSSRGFPGRINALANALLSAEHKKLHLQRASQRVWRIMRHWLSLAGVSATLQSGRARRRRCASPP